MIKKTSLLIIFFIFTITSFAQIGSTIPSSDRGDWQNAGYPGTIPSTYSDTIVVNGFYYNAIKSALDQAKNLSGRILVYLPSGIYNIHRPIILDSQYNNITIRGEILSNGTRAELKFWYDSAWPDDNYTNQSYSDAQSLIRIENASEIGLENFKISAENLLGAYYYIPRISSGLKYNVLFRNSNNSWITNIESFKPFRQHIVIWYNSHNIEIKHNYLHEAYSYGVGGSGYGVLINGNSYSCLIENNVFRKLRHSMIVANEAHDNVFGYNYSCQQTDGIGNVLADICIHGENDPNFGGAYKNLFEGNRVDRIHADLYWGTNGSYNTFFRNFVYYGTIKIETEREDRGTWNCVGNNYYNILGNEGETIYVKYLFDGTNGYEVPATKPLDTFDRYGTNNFYYSSGGISKLSDIAPIKYFDHQNWSINYENDKYLEDISYYHASKPSFISSSFSWPCLGPAKSPNQLTTQNIPARWRACNELGWACSPTRDHDLSEQNNDNVEEFIENTRSNLIQNYPNPFNPSTLITYQIPKNGFVNLVVYNSLGQEVTTLVNEHQTIGKYSVQFNASSLPSGVYFYKIESGDFTKVNKMLLLR
ncbi:MAG: T9SS type A sorting domain-containing protein [Bacteroidetes bacterium]|nr:T9SS type A sorting domain-containing protein [Bacteroidota bacterium]MBU1114139.1 T9SS type A sorting domain-containing protein [Bacteroidota bacterium]MBU1796805.1 T9SS type A sorting domain-containing protein [Bacteroidota bacterium]